VSADGYRADPTGPAHRLFLNRDEPVALAGPHRLSLRVTMRYRVVPA